MQKWKARSKEHSRNTPSTTRNIGQRIPSRSYYSARFWRKSIRARRYFLPRRVSARRTRKRRGTVNHRQRSWITSPFAKARSLKQRSHQVELAPRTTDMLPWVRPVERRFLHAGWNIYPSPPSLFLLLPSFPPPPSASPLLVPFSLSPPTLLPRRYN